MSEILKVIERTGEGDTMESPAARPLAVNLEKAAELLGLSRPVVTRMLYAGELPGFKVGPRWVISVTALDDYVTARSKQEASERAGRGQRAI